MGLYCRAPSPCAFLTRNSPIWDYQNGTPDRGAATDWHSNSACQTLKRRELNRLKVPDGQAYTFRP